MPTNANPKYIRSTDGNYPNLKEEIKDISSKISTRDNNVSQLMADVTSLNSEIDRINETYGTEIDTIKEDILNIESSINTVQEVVQARGEHSSLDERLDAIEHLDIFRENLKLTTTRNYEYNSNGDVTAEEITGDINYRIEYIYDEEGNILSEKHYHNGEVVGTKIYEYHPTLGCITKVISDKADHMELVYNDTTTRDLDSRLSKLEDLSIGEKLDAIYRTLFIGQYDGKKLTDMVYSFNARLESLEALAPDKIENILSTPEILKRIEDLELAVGSPRINDTFIITSSKTYTLSRPTTPSRIKITAEGIPLAYGELNDYILLPDNKTIELKVNIVEGMEINCEYY